MLALKVMMYEVSSDIGIYGLAVAQDAEQVIY